MSMPNMPPLPPPAPSLSSPSPGESRQMAPDPASDTDRDAASRDAASGPRRMLAVAMVAGLAGAAVAAPTAVVIARSSTSVASEVDTVAQPVIATADASTFDARLIAAQVTPSVVRVDVSGSAGQGAGSGVAWDDDGIIVTNNHVVTGAQVVTVTTSNGRTLETEVVGTWPAADLAVLRVDASLDAIKVADAPADLGEQVLAIGSPFGLDGSVTSGIVSAVGRTVTTSGTALPNLLQTDAAINPGNSGGALVNGAGELLGINTVIATSGGGSDGIGFAIDAATVDDVVLDLLDDGRVSQPVLGVTGANLADPTIIGAPITSVLTGSAADEGGLVAGDLVTAINDEPVANFAELAARVVRLAPGDIAMLDVTHADGSRASIEVTLQAQSASRVELSPRHSGRAELRPRDIGPCRQSPSEGPHQPNRDDPTDRCTRTHPSRVHRRVVQPR